MSSIGKLIVFSASERKKLAEYKLGVDVFLIGRGQENDQSRAYCGNRREAGKTHTYT